MADKITGPIFFWHHKFTAIYVTHILTTFLQHVPDYNRTYALFHISYHIISYHIIYLQHVPDYNRTYALFHILYHIISYHIIYLQHVPDYNRMYALFHRSYHIISYHLFSFRRSIQNYIIHMDMEIVIFVGIKVWHQHSVYSNHMVIWYDKYKLGQYGLFSVIKYNNDKNNN